MISPNDQPDDKRHHLVVVGGGFGGLQCIKSLKGAGLRITLIDQRNHQQCQRQAVRRLNALAQQHGQLQTGQHHQGPHRGQGKPRQGRVQAGRQPGE